MDKPSTTPQRIPLRLTPKEREAALLIAKHYLDLNRTLVSGDEVLLVMRALRDAEDTASERAPTINAAGVETPAEPCAAGLAERSAGAAPIHHDKQRIACVYRTGCETPNDCQEHGYCRSPKIHTTSAERVVQHAAIREDGHTVRSSSPDSECSGDGDAKTPDVCGICGLFIRDGDVQGDACPGHYRRATATENLRILAARLSEQLSPAEKRHLEEAAGALSASERKLTKPARVGGTIFDTGVGEQLVIDRAQREYEYQKQPPFDAARIAKFKEFVESVNRPTVVTDAMVDRFLSWPLPASVCSDLCVTRTDYPHSRIGTNLLTADEARQMLEHVLAGVASANATERYTALVECARVCHDIKMHNLRIGHDERAQTAELIASRIRALMPNIAPEERPMLCPPERFSEFKARVMCHWPQGLFRVMDDPDPHKPCYLVCPDGASVGFSHHDGEGVDRARVQFIVDACNAVLALSPQRFDQEKP